MSDTHIIKCKRLHPNAKLFEYSRDRDACMDVYALHDFEIPAHSQAIIKTGIAIELPTDYEGIIRGRSGLASKGIRVHTGTVDETYRGDVGVIIYNDTDSSFMITQHMRIAQFTIKPVTRFSLIEADELSTTERGENGYGSSGL